MPRILVVEDNKMNLELFSTILTMYGYETLLATNGAEGVRMAREEAPDLILMDVQMPGMNGIEALTILREDPAARSIPVIALTAFGMDETAGMRMFDDFLAKPIDMDAFIACVERNLGRRGDGI